MKISIQIVMDDAHGEAGSSVEIFTLHRESLEGETLMLTEQVCPHCQAPRRCKNIHQIRLRTLFGEVSLPSPVLVWSPYLLSKANPSEDCQEAIICQWGT